MNKIQKALNTIIAIFYYKQIINKLKNTNSNIFFIFSSYQIGGAERVHSDIMALVANLNPTCIITTIPLNSGFKKDFLKSARIIELKRWGLKKSFIPIMAKKIAQTINKRNDAIVFGSNSSFLYDLIPHLKLQVKIVDLTHAFTETWTGMELQSLSHVDRIDQRIVLGNSTLNDYKFLYKKNNIPNHYLDKFKIIPNQVALPVKYIEKEWRLPLNIVFVSRNSPDKRPELFFQIVEECVKQKLSVKFTIVGDFAEYKNRFKENVLFKGEIQDKTILNTIYKEAHLILLTSIIEGFPMVLLEGMAYGVVPISTDVGEIPSFISEKSDTGYLVDHTLPTSEIIYSFVEIIKKCSLQTSLIPLISKSCFEMVDREFNYTQFKEAYLKIFRS